MEKISAKFDARILVVEDYFINQELIKEILTMMHCHVDVADNGKEALKKHSSQHYDLILMDIQMPEMDGVTVMHEIRKKEGNERHTPIVALTANALQTDKKKYLSSGMDDYLSKPIQIKDLENLLRKFLPISTVGEG